MKRASTPVLSVIIVLLFPNILCAGEIKTVSGWSMTVHAGIMADGDKGTLGDTISGAEYSGTNNMIMGAVSKELYRYHDILGFELEGQFGKHGGTNEYYEAIGAAYIRWLRMPFEEHIRTSVAAGAGLSYASSIPAVEYRRDQRSENLLGYLGLEFTVGLPKLPQWDLVFRLHHRSGAKGVIGYGDANYIGAGIKINF